MTFECTFHLKKMLNNPLCRPKPLFHLLMMAPALIVVLFHVESCAHGLEKLHTPSFLLVFKLGFVLEKKPGVFFVFIVCPLWIKFFRAQILYSFVPFTWQGLESLFIRIFLNLATSKFHFAAILLSNKANQQPLNTRFQTVQIPMHFFPPQAVSFQNPTSQLHQFLFWQN